MEIAVKRSACMGSGPAIVPLNSSGCITLQWGVGRDLLFRLVPCYHIVLGGKLTSHLPLSRTVSTFLYLSDRRRTFSQKLGDNISIFTVFGINFQIHSVSLSPVLSLFTSSSICQPISLIIPAPLSSSITPSLFHSRLKTYLFNKSFLL